LVYLLGFRAYIIEMHGSRSKIPSKKSRPCMYDVKFLAVLGAPYIYDISRLRVNKALKNLLTVPASVTRLYNSCLFSTITVFDKYYRSSFRSMGFTYV
jgi:hypothetical protein